MNDDTLVDIDKRLTELEQRTEPLAISQSIRTEERLDALERVVAQLDGALSQFECCDVDQAQLISALERTVARLVGCVRERR